MATYTEHYNLKKPDTTDYVNIQDLNGNADIIDAALAGKAESADVSAKYTKPAGGIPASDLAESVQTSLDKADNALQADLDETLTVHGAAADAKATGDAIGELKSTISLTDKDDENKLYAMAWSVENGFPVLTLTERT